MERFNLMNLVLLVLVALPPLCMTYVLRSQCSAKGASLSYVCGLYMLHPGWTMNILWTLHVDITFYVISLFQVCPLHVPAPFS
jgi:hypothetical protein